MEATSMREEADLQESLLQNESQLKDQSKRKKRLQEVIRELALLTSNLGQNLKEKEEKSLAKAKIIREINKLSGVVEKQTARVCQLEKEKVFLLCSLHHSVLKY